MPHTRHSVFDDGQGLLTGTLLVALGLALMRHGGLMTGGTVGLALLVQHAAGWPFGPVFFALNLPFYWLAWQRMGKAFTLKTVGAVTLLAVLGEALPHWLVLAQVQPLVGALVGGTVIGVGFVVLFRHRASLGGLSVVALMVQERLGWRAGHVLLAIDGAILLASWPWIGLERLALSVLAAVAMNLAVAVNHRPGRYVAL